MKLISVIVAFASRSVIGYDAGLRPDVDANEREHKLRMEFCRLLGGRHEIGRVNRLSRDLPFDEFGRHLDTL